MQSVGLWRMMELSPHQRHWGDMITLRVWSSDRSATRKPKTVSLVWSTSGEPCLYYKVLGWFLFWDAGHHVKHSLV